MVLFLSKKEDAQFIDHADVEPLRDECAHFIKCIKTRETPLTDAKSGIEVLKVLHACQSVLSKMVSSFQYEFL